MHVLLIEPDYYTRYPPLGLLKLSTYHKLQGDTTELLRGKKIPKHKPELIYVTSLFTYVWKPVHASVKFYKKLFPKTKLVLGGIYASLMPEHAKKSGADKIHIGLFKKAEKLLPDYSLVPEWGASIIFTTRGCVRKCPWCAVPKLEGEFKSVIKNIKSFIFPRHTKLILWDNNLLADPNCENILDELEELNLKVDFNQGLDARLVTEKIAMKLSHLKFDLLRFAYDHTGMRRHVKKAIKVLSEYGVRKRKMIFYTMFNYKDEPEDFFQRVKELLEWGVASYPMRFQPLDSLKKNSYISPKWTKEELEIVAKARRVLGYAGAFPPYKGLREKFKSAKDFHEAFTLRPIDWRNEIDHFPDLKLNERRKITPRYGGTLDWREYYRKEIVS